jgi:hypothetical protein
MLDVLLLSLASAFSRCRSVTPTHCDRSEEVPMVFDYALAGAVTAGLMSTSSTPLLDPERL